MLRPRRSAAPPLLAALLAVLVASCGPGASPSPSGSGGGSASGSGSAAPRTEAAPTTAGPPDVQEVVVQAQGFGAFDLITTPVAQVLNRSTTHTAVGVQVTFRVLAPNGHVLVTGEDTLPSLAPGATAVVAVNTEPGGLPGSVDAAVAVAQWGPRSTEVLQASGGAYHCDRCGRTRQRGEVSGTVVSTTAKLPPTIHLAALCLDAAGTIVGGGAAPFAWPAGQTTTDVVEPVLLTGTPVACKLSATTG